MKFSYIAPRTIHNEQGKDRLKKSFEKVSKLIGKYPKSRVIHL
ncbi:hypothetical protein [Wolbachia endosymbiont of Litomosoides sigmodontis]|nr:hypothetical protein [Wolbachia endosymbiont of Litomosoides sigmodontis]